MYIEFSLPSTSAGAGLVLHHLYDALEHWAQRYSVEYRKKLVKYTLRVTFDEDSMYDFFAMTWNPQKGKYLIDHYISCYRFVVP